MMTSYMNSRVRVILNVSAAQRVRLEALQSTFSEACNALAPTVQITRCWNRVALHHMTYKRLRERFPTLGSQMVCNAIYSVSRAARIVYQHPKSPCNIQQLGTRPLPLLKFSLGAPVYFDRHTLSLKDGVLSLFTLDGRMRFDLNVSATNEARFRTGKLREIAYTANANECALDFAFADGDEASDDDPAKGDGRWPEYVLVMADNTELPAPVFSAMPIERAMAAEFHTKANP